MILPEYDVVNALVRLQTKLLLMRLAVLVVGPSPRNGNERIKRLQNKCKRRKTKRQLTCSYLTKLAQMRFSSSKEKKGVAPM